jgi:pimeloyl-ACP methyl ester carboxylesterase
VSDLQELHVEESGNPEGKPVLSLHGGPGGGTSPKHRRYFDPERYRIILFDQRVWPECALRRGGENNTWELVAGIERIREHLGLQRWLFFGGSWGATSKLIPDPDFIASYGDEATTLAFARIECHYFLNKGWFEEAQLLRDAPKLQGIPGAIIQGRYDMVCPLESAWALSKAWLEADLVIVPDAGHSAYDPGISRALVAATDRMA